MINIFNVLDANKYEVKKIKNGIEIYYIENEMLYQNKFIRLIHEENREIVYLISRGNHKEIGVFQKRILALSIIIILCYKNFERGPENSVIKREIIKAAESNDIKGVLEIIENECDDRFYEIFNFKKNTVCIIKNNNSYNVYYKSFNEDKEIVTDASLGRAFIVLLNYTKLLENYDKLYKEISSSFGFEENYYYTILEYYMF